MMEAVVEALRDTDCFGLIAVARPEYMKFEARSDRAIYQEYQRVKDERFTRLHLDHVPVIDEDNLSADDEYTKGAQRAWRRSGYPVVISWYSWGTAWFAGGEEPVQRAFFSPLSPACIKPDIFPSCV
jgi:hypothetical protein